MITEKNMERYQKYFKVGNIVYEFLLSRTYEVAFGAVNGTILPGGKLVTDDNLVSGNGVSPTEIFNINKNPFPVMREVLKCLTDAIYTNAPPYFRLRAGEEKRQRIYRKLIPRIEKATGYSLTCQYMNFDTEVYQFTRMA